MPASRTACLFLALLYSMNCPAAEVYKWVDEDGNTHYGDRPARDDARPLNLEIHPGNSDDELRQRREKRDKLLEVFAEEREREQQERAKRAAEQARQQERCRNMRQQLQQYRQSRYLYEENENGERRILTDAERATEEQKLRRILEKECA